MPLLKTNILLFIFLAVATLISHTWVDRYEQDGPELLTDNWSTRASKNSRADITENELTLFSSESRISVSIHQEIPRVEPDAVLKLSAEVKTDDVVAGEKPWNQARLLLVQNDGKKDRWDLPSLVVSLTGTSDWERYHNAFTIDPETKRIRVVAQLNQSTGLFQVKNIQLHAVSEAQAFTWIRNIIFGSWGAFFLLLVGSCLFMGRKTVLFRTLLVSVFICIIIGTTIPGNVREQVSHEIKTQMHAESHTIQAVIPWDLSKVWHFCFFSFLGLILCLMMAKESTIQLMALILLLAGGTEIVQLYIDGRSPLFTDFFIDAAGGLSGIALIRLIGTNKNTGHFESDQ
jgi:hypothetical protein